MPETYNYDITVTNRAPVVTQRPSQPPTTGSTGITVTPSFEGHYWDGLEIFAVFKAYTASAAIALTGTSVEIPTSVLQRSGVRLYVGFQGVNAAGSVVKESQYALLDTVAGGATIEDAGNYDEFSPALYAQILTLARAAQLAAGLAVDQTQTETLIFVISTADNLDDYESYGVEDIGHLLAVRTAPGDLTVVRGVTDLGAVTAYAAAVDEGYEGTEAEFVALLTANMATQQSVTQALAQIGTISQQAQAASDSAALAAQDAAAAVNAATNAATSASNAQTAVAGKQAQHKTTTCTLTAGTNVKTWTVTATGVTATNTVFVDFAAASYAEAVTCMIRCTGQSANSLTFAANTAPENDINVNVVIFD